LKLVRVQTDAGPFMGVLDGDDRVTLLPDRESTAVVSRALAAGGLAPLAANGTTRPLAGEPVWMAPLSDPRKIVAIGLNYRDHANESSMVTPAEPVIFAKFPSSIVGPGARIVWHADLTSAVDYEAELAVIIGKPARRVSVERALDHVFGYTCLNDVSARDLQFGDGGQWVRAKSIDSFCPIGPWIVTADEISDPQALPIRCIVAGEVLQDGTTADMIFSVAELISRLSHSFTLETGDVIATGTPSGVGWFRSPRRMLKAGDEVIVEIGGVGTLSNPVEIM
jgi:2-keto-4-pentenoate hydratase/2-oxohepta-3-ene-1,7-dioic acid hydratase in catechol pathway